MMLTLTMANFSFRATKDTYMHYETTISQHITIGFNWTTFYRSLGLMAIVLLSVVRLCSASISSLSSDHFYRPWQYDMHRSFSRMLCLIVSYRSWSTSGPFCLHGPRHEDCTARSFCMCPAHSGKQTGLARSDTQRFGFCNLEIRPRGGQETVQVL